MTSIEERQKILFVGQERICKQIAYVLDIPDYAIAEKLTAQNFDQYRDYQIYVCDFKHKSSRLVKKEISRTATNIQYLDDICRTIDEAYDANRKRHGNDKPGSKINQVSSVRKPLWYRLVRGMKHPLRAAGHVVLRVKETVRRHPKKRIRKGSLKYLQGLKPSELMLYVLRAKPIQHIQCTRLETDAYIFSNHVKGCHGTMLPFGNLLDDGELNEIYRSTYARIIKLSSLNRSYCLCNLYRNCRGYCTNETVLPTDCWETPAVPKLMNIAFSHQCNLCCKSCRTEPYVMDAAEQQRIPIITAKLLRSGWLEQADTLCMSGSGEVFYSPDYRQLLTTGLLRQQIRIFSNGTLFNESNWRLLDGKYNTIDVKISVDAATAETYQKLRGADFNQLLKNLTMLSDLRRKNKIHKFSLNFVVQRDNFREMPAFVKLAQSLGVDKVNFQRLNNWGTFAVQEFLNQCLIVDDKYLDYALWCVLQDPIFKDPIVDLIGLQRYIDASERRYRRRYEREQKRRSV